jgi:thiol:disulfide interchange protein
MHHLCRALARECGVTGRSNPMSSNSRAFLIPIAAAVIGALSLASAADAHSQAGLFKPNPHLYSENSNAATDISAAISRASREHKRILLDFGGNWCGDCQVLDIYYHQSPNAELLAKHFILVHINIGHMDENVAIAQKYNVPIKKGVPALAVLDSHGKLLYVEHDKEFEHTSPSAITDFLNRWKA